MDADRWRRINELFHGALERSSGEREAYLQEACDDEALRREVDSLLRSHAEADTFIEQPAYAFADDPPDGDDTLSWSPESLIGETIGPYAVRAMLGAGGMGVVYLAEDVRLQRKVALKALAEHLGRDRRSRDRLRREARAAAALSHPGIATVYALEEFDDRLYIAYEYADGPTLRQELRGGPLPGARLRATALAIAAALQAAHDRGIVHRDLKPENVIRTAEGGIKVLDFGLATPPQPALVAADERDGERLTLPGMLIGTPSYMSPEQLQGAEVDFRSDLFSLGILLSELATGVHPFEGASVASTIARILEVEPRALVAGGDEAAAGMEPILRRLLAKRPEDRYAATAQLVDALQELPAASTPPVTPPRERGGAPEPVSPTFSRELSGPTAGPRSGPHDGSRHGAFWWWRFHQLAVTAIYGTTLYCLWLAKGAAEGGGGQLAGVLLFYGGIAVAIAAGSLRLHLAFAARYYPEELPRQLPRAARWIRPAEFLYGAILLGGAALLGPAHPLPAALVVAAATGIVVVGLAIEPTTTRAAFPRR